MNRPRPRRLINVIKSSDNLSPDDIDSSNLTKFVSQPVNKNSSDSQLTSSSNYSIDIVDSAKSMATKFVPRKPIVTSLKKASIPPPPPFSSSPSHQNISNIPQVARTSNIQTEQPSYTENYISNPFSTIQKSNGEVFLDAADKAAEYIGSTLFNSFKKLNISDSISPKSTESSFADIMANLASSPKENTDKIRSKNPTLMDEEPPQSFNSLLYSSDYKSNAESTTETLNSQHMHVSSDYNEDLQISKSPNNVELNNIQNDQDSFGKNNAAENEFDETSAIKDISYRSLLNTDIVSPQNSTTSSNPTGFRASILRHGLDALEKISKTTADVVVTTKNKLTETSNFSADSVVTPNFFDKNSTFYDIFMLYGGHEKLQDLQLKAVKASIALKLTAKTRNATERSSFEYNSREKLQTQVSTNLHADQILEKVDLTSDSFYDYAEISSFFLSAEDEINCIQRLLKSLDTISIDGSTENEDEGLIVSSNRRRHILCQISVVLSDFLENIMNFAKVSNIDIDFELFSNYLSRFVLNIIKYLQINFEKNCHHHRLADKDQQSAVKLFLDMVYTLVPRIQLFLN